MAEKIFTIPLRREWLKVPKYRRAKKAINALNIYLKKHLKKDVKIGKYLNSLVWARGNENPPGKVKVRIEEDKEKLTAELINAPREVKKEKKKKGRLEKLKETIVGESKEKKEQKELSKELGKELQREEEMKRHEVPQKEDKERMEKERLVARKEDIKK